MKMRTVVVGVFLGMWLFVLSVFALALVLGRTTLEAVASTSTSTVPTVPGTPSSMP